MRHSRGPVVLAAFLWVVVVSGLGYGVFETLRTVGALFGG
jgi:hypothetical protein